MKYIFFDLGYTLVNEDEVWKKRCEEQSGTSQAVACGITAARLLSDIEEASLRFEPQFKSVIAKYGFSQSAPYRSEYETLYADTACVLEKMHKHFRLGIIANQSGDLISRLKNWDIYKYFSTVVWSADCGFSKPDERLFTVALEKCGYPARECVMVGDRLDNDIYPANKLGFTTVRIRRGFAANQIPPSELYKPDYEIDDMSEILTLPFIKKTIG